MSGPHAVLIDNTTIDSAIRFLSTAEIDRRREIGWCLRDVSDLSCLSSFLDALIFFDTLHVVPLERASPSPTSASGATRMAAPSAIVSSGPAAVLRGCVTDLPLDVDWGMLDQEAQGKAESRMKGDSVLWKTVALPQVSRTVHSIERGRDGSPIIVQSGTTKEDVCLSLRRTYLYDAAAQSWADQRQDGNLSVWLSPERAAIVQKLIPSLEREEAMLQRRDFNAELTNVGKLIPTSPSLMTLLAKAGIRQPSSFGEYLVEQVQELRSAKAVEELRSLFRQGLASPLTKNEIVEWATFKPHEALIDLIGLIPTAGTLVQLLIKWGVTPSLRLLGSVMSWRPSARQFIRDVVNECRNLGVREVRDLATEFFAGRSDESTHRSEHRLDRCVTTFTTLLAGGQEWEQRQTVACMVPYLKDTA